MEHAAVGGPAAEGRDEHQGLRAAHEHQQENGGGSEKEDGLAAAAHGRRRASGVEPQERRRLEGDGDGVSPPPAVSGPALRHGEHVSSRAHAPLAAVAEEEPVLEHARARGSRRARRSASAPAARPPTRASPAHEPARRREEDEAAVRAQPRARAVGLLHLRPQQVAHGQELRHEARARGVVDLGGRADLLDHAFVHDRDAVAQGQGLLLVVGHEHERGAEAPVQRLHFRPHLLAQLAVEGGHRLVEEQHLRLQHHRAREGHPLALPAGELVDAAPLQPGQPHHLQRARDALRDLARAARPAISRPKATFPATSRCGKRA